LGKGCLEKVVEGILDVLFIQTTFLVDYSARRGGHGRKGGRMARAQPEHNLKLGSNSAEMCLLRL
jgi:hypothetical protein